MTPSLVEFCSYDTPGLLTLEYVYLKDVVRSSQFAIVAPDWNRRYVPVIAEGGWQKLPLLLQPRWVETVGQTVHGSRFTHNVTARTPQLYRTAAKVFDALSRNRLLLRITDADKREWVVGNHEQAFRLSYQRQPGGDGSFVGYDLQLTGETSHSTAQYNPFL